MFRDLYKKSLEYNHNIISRDLTDNINDLFAGGNVERTYKKLIKYKYPIDYLRKNNNVL